MIFGPNCEIQESCISEILGNDITVPLEVLIPCSDRTSLKMINYSMFLTLFIPFSSFKSGLNNRKQDFFLKENENIMG